jgi:hypothetical protein
MLSVVMLNVVAPEKGLYDGSLVVGSEDVNVVGFFRQLPDALEGDGGIVVVVELDVAATTVALGLLHSSESL